jgi:hypothetical protein
MIQAEQTKSYANAFNIVSIFGLDLSKSLILTSIVATPLTNSFVPIVSNISLVDLQLNAFRFP